MEGCVFSIEEFSVYDGPGIRTTVFLKGCPLRCSWCHNPEGQKTNPEIVRSPNGCIQCNNCIRYGEIKDGTTVFTQESIQNCPVGLLRLCGEKTDSRQLCQHLLKNKKLLQNGGITFSGGEPLFQSAFLLECLEILKREIHTAVQTSGYCDAPTFDRVLEKADYFLYDLKLANRELHRRYTGVFNDQILRNFSALVKSGKGFTVRIPLIPGVTDTQENIQGIVSILKEHNVTYVELLPYNRMAGGKYKMVGREYTPDFDPQKAVTIPDEILRTHHINYKEL